MPSTGGARPRRTASTPTIATRAISPGVFAPASGPGRGREPREARLVDAAHAHDVAQPVRLAPARDHEHVRAGLFNARSSASSSPWPWVATSTTGASSGDSASRIRRRSARKRASSAAGVLAEHAERAARAVGLDEELDRAVARAGHRVLLDIRFGLNPSLEMRTSLGSPCAIALLRRADDDILRAASADPAVQRPVGEDDRLRANVRRRRRDSPDHGDQRIGLAAPVQFARQFEISSSVIAGPR